MSWPLLKAQPPRTANTGLLSMVSPTTTFCLLCGNPSSLHARPAENLRLQQQQHPTGAYMLNCFAGARLAPMPDLVKGMLFCAPATNMTSAQLHAQSMQRPAMDTLSLQEA